MKSSNNHDIAVRFAFIIVCVVAFCVVILHKASVTIFLEGEHWQKKIARCKVENNIIEPKRGNIFADDGRLLASSIPQYNVYMDFLADGLRKDTLTKYLPQICKMLSSRFGEMSPEGYRRHLLQGYAKQSRNYKIIKRRISYTEMKDLKESAFFNKGKNKSGLILTEMAQRKNPFGQLASRTIGDVYGDMSKGGRSGIEMSMDSMLRGVPGHGTREKVNGRYMVVPQEEAVDGYDVTTTINVDIQDITHKALLDKLVEIDAESGVAVVMEVKTGAICAMSNLGRVAPGTYMETKNYAVSDESEPGSTFKVASMMVALDKGVVSPGDSVDTGDGLWMYKGVKMTDHNHEHGGYGKITAAQSIWYSSNIGVAKLILKGFDKKQGEFVEGLYNIGLNKKFNLLIPGTTAPKIKHPNDTTTRWSGTSLAWMSFGYETQIPPIYTLAFYNAIANDGKMMKPFLVKKISKDGKVYDKESPEVVNSMICKRSTLTEIRRMLEDVVDKGTGKIMKSENIRLAGKTGTALISQGSKGYSGAGRFHQVSFCGYFPAEKPLYSCIVVIRKPGRGYPSGGAMSGVVFRNIAEKTYSKSKQFQIEKNTDEDAEFVPRMKNGRYQDLVTVLDELDIDNEYDGKAWDWATVKVREGKVVMQEYSPMKNLVPNVAGMGAKDAVYIMENAGLRVSLNGKGRVYSQSITPGSNYNKGTTIVLNLR